MADIETLKQETRVFTASKEFSKAATIGSMDTYHAMCADASADYESFWANLAREVAVVAMLRCSISEV